MERGVCKMKRRIVPTLVLVCVSVLMLACSSTSTSPNNIFYAWNQKAEIGVGDTLTVTLESNPTTGFEWELREFSEEGILELMGSEYQPGEEAKQDIPVPGAGGLEVWTFKGIKKGQTVIFLDYNQPWDSGIKADKFLMVRVTVK